MNYAIYLRKSRADLELEAHGELETLARHERALIDYAKKNGFGITYIYKEIVSGETISARPEAQKLLADVEAGLYSGVLVMEIERLARGDTMDQGLVAHIFKQSGTKIITPVKIYDPNNEFDEEYFEFGLFMARREYKTINRRIQRGRIASVQEGKYIGSQPAFGYDKVPIKNSKGYTLIPNNDAETVRMIYDLYVNHGMGMTLIANELDKLHIKPQKSNVWSRMTIRDILSNPVYIGKIRWSYKKETKTNINGKIKKKRTKSNNYTITDGIHEPVIDNCIYEKAQSIRLKKGHPPVKGSDILKNPFSGLIYCGKCGHMLTRLVSNKRNKYDTLKCPNRSCDNISAPLFLIEEKILKAINLWMQEYKMNLQQNLNIPVHNTDIIKKNSIHQIISDISKYKKQLELTYELVEQGIYSRDEFINRNMILSERITTLESKKLDLEEQLNLSASKDNMEKNTIPTIEFIMEGYYSLPSALEKNAVMKSVLDKIVYIKTERNTKGNLHNDNFELILYPIFLSNM